MATSPSGAGSCRGKGWSRTCCGRATDRLLARGPPTITTTEEAIRHRERWCRAAHRCPVHASAVHRARADQEARLSRAGMCVDDFFGGGAKGRRPLTQGGGVDAAGQGARLTEEGAADVGRRGRNPLLRIDSCSARATLSTCFRSSTAAPSMSATPPTTSPLCSTSASGQAPPIKREKKRHP